MFKTFFHTTKQETQQGQIFIIGIILMAILTTTSGSLWGYTVLQVKSSRQAVTNSQALQLAEAGIDKALHELNKDSNFNGESAVSLTGGQFSTTVTTIDANNKRITSIGYVPSVANPQEQKTVKMDVSIDLNTVAFNFGVQVGEGGLSMANNSRVNGNIYSNGNITGSGLITGDATVAGGGSPTLDQQCTTNSSAFNFNTTAKRDVAQRFTSTLSATVTRVSVFLKKTGSPSNITVRIVTDNNGSPSRTVVGGTGTISSSSITTTFGWINATFSTPPALTSGTNYWLVLDTSSSATNYYSWAQDVNDSCANGTAKYSTDWNQNPPTWVAISRDMNFQVYMGGATTRLSGVTVNGTARANTLQSCTIGLHAYYQTISSCSVAGTKYPGTADSSQQVMPISQPQIDEWKSDAESGGIINGNYSRTNGQSATLGPIRINGNMTLDNNVTLDVTGPIWVKGNITIGNNVTVRVSSTLGNASSIIIADNPDNPTGSGRISLDNNVSVRGNNNTGSYLIVLSTKQDGAQNAFNLGNNVTSSSTPTSVFYASSGTMGLDNNAVAAQLTAYAISLSNNVIITYSSGLQDTNFSSGPGGSWAKVAGTYFIIP
jgi:Tfp pilus assembly protein PilX